MKNNGFRLLCLFTSMLLLFSCKNDQKNNLPASTGNTDVDALVNMNAPAGFQYRTDQQIALNITVLAPDDTPIKKAKVNILDAETASKVLYTCFTDDNGQITGNLNLPAYMSSVVVDPGYPGVIHNAKVNLVNKTVLCTLGGQKGYSGNVVPESTPGQRLGARPMGFNYSYMGTYTSQGKPNYLEPTNDVITSEYLSWIAASLPEQKTIANSHPAFLSNDVKTTLEVTALSDVWFTFVSEGAGYLNSIAYYTYQTANPPQTTADIDSLHIIIPNASLNGSGGAMTPGNKVKLGRFAAGTSIGFALIGNGWNGSAVGAGVGTVYSDDNLNPETSASLKRHTVLLYDDTHKNFLVGFEDMRRDNSGCDNDFNDLLFNVISNPVTALSRIGVNPIDKPIDADGDGVSDIYDQFPNDPSRAYINYAPSQNGYGTLAFEDNWPFLGDYDMNDLVLGYNYSFTNNAANYTIAINANFVIKASGAYFHNGFGVEFPFAASNVQSVTGTRVSNSDVVTFASNGCEAGQTKAVIIPFDDAFTATSIGSGFNTYLTNAFFTPDTIKMTITLKTPVSASSLGTAPFNPFIIIDKTRGREAHLAGCTPTQKVNAALFRTGHDNTSPSQNIYYKTKSNLPWAISFTENFDYPVEGRAINTAYTHFVPWAQSGGTSYTNWYIDASNVVTNNVYKR